VPKHRNIQTLYTLCHFGVSHFGISGLASTRFFPLNIPGAETLKHRISSALLSFWGLVSRDSVTNRYKGTDPWVSQVPKHRNIQTLDTLWDFRTGEYKRLALRYLGYQNTETPYLICSIIISGSHKSRFREMRRYEVSYLGFPRVKTPNHISSKLTSWFHKSRFRYVK
jgi:hypothetical protein